MASWYARTMESGAGATLRRGSVVADRYRLGDVLGEGGSAVVFECEDLKLGRKLALKTLRPVHGADRTAALRLTREARLAALVSHPNVCAVSDLGALADGSPFLVMERLVGETLGVRLSRRGALPAAAAVAIAMQVLSALSEVHEAGIVHRDVKPGNVFVLAPTGLADTTKLLDFGAALCASFSSFDDGPLTATGMVVGTPHYLSPEQVAGRRDLDARADLYQVGVLLYQMLSGRCPFEGGSLAEVMRAIASAAFPPLSSVLSTSLPELDSVVARGMALAREVRFQSASHFQEALAPLAAESLSPREPEWEVATQRDVGADIEVVPDVATDVVTRHGRII
jgi:serine/threonine protein kinase